MDTSDKHYLAEMRIREMGFTQTQLDYIWADWPNWDEHLSWLLTATKEDILEWIEAGSR